MKALFDTHTLLWALLSPALLSVTVSEIVQADRNTLYVSAASAWEIATKVRSGKLRVAEKLEHSFLEQMEAADYEVLAIDASTALRAGRLTSSYKDPFDRMIAAQALALDIPVLSRDAALDSFGVRRFW